MPQLLLFFFSKLSLLYSKTYLVFLKLTPNLLVLLGFSLVAKLLSIQLGLMNHTVIGMIAITLVYIIRKVTLNNTTSKLYVLLLCYVITYNMVLLIKSYIVIITVELIHFELIAYVFTIISSVIISEYIIYIKPEKGEQNSFSDFQDYEDPKDPKDPKDPSALPLKQYENKEDTNTSSSSNTHSIDQLEESVRSLADQCSRTNELIGTKYEVAGSRILHELDSKSVKQVKDLTVRLEQAQNWEYVRDVYSSIRYNSNSTPRLNTQIRERTNNLQRWSSIYQMTKELYINKNGTLSFNSKFGSQFKDIDVFINKESLDEKALIKAMELRDSYKNKP